MLVKEIKRVRRLKKSSHQKMLSLTWATGGVLLLLAICFFGAFIFTLSGITMARKLHGLGVAVAPADANARSRRRGSGSSDDNGDLFASVEMGGDDDDDEVNEEHSLLRGRFDSESSRGGGSASPLPRGDDGRSSDAFSGSDSAEEFLGRATTKSAKRQQHTGRHSALFGGRSSARRL